MVQSAILGDTENAAETSSRISNTTSGMCRNFEDKNTGCELNKPARTSTLFDKYVFFMEQKIGTRSTCVVLVAEAELESSAEAQQKQKVYIAAVVSAPRYTRPEPGQCFCACVLSINLLKIDTHTSET